MITVKEASNVALRHGLSLSDAAALSRMSLESVEEADEIAAQFAAPPKPVQLSRADLASLTPAEVEEARIAGKLSDVMGGQKP